MYIYYINKYMYILLVSPCSEKKHVCSVGGWKGENHPPGGS